MKKLYFSFGLISVTLRYLQFSIKKIEYKPTVKVLIWIAIIGQQGNLF